MEMAYRNMLTLVLALAMPSSAVSYVQPKINSGPIPPAAFLAGYKTRTFHIGKFDEHTFDAGATYRPGYLIYPFNFFFTRKFRENVINNDGSISARGNNGSLVSAACSNKSCTSFVGTAFGGGAYIEAEVSYDPSRIDLKTGWPAVWMLTIESIVRSPGFQWAGQPTGFNHSVEVDILEHHLGPAVHGYGVAVHDWSGFYLKSCPETPYCRFTNGGKVILDQKVSMTDYHRVGMLWKPATDKRLGSVQFYFDREPVGPVTTWRKFDPLTVKPSMDRASWAWGVIDRSHMVLILGAGTSTPMRVRSVEVWQASSANNLVQ